MHAGVYIAIRERDCCHLKIAIFLLANVTILEKIRTGYTVLHISFLRIFITISR